MTAIKITVANLLIARQSMTIPPRTKPVRIRVKVSRDPRPDLLDLLPSEIIDSVVSARPGGFS